MWYGVVLSLGGEVLSLCDVVCWLSAVLWSSLDVLCL